MSWIRSIHYHPPFDPGLNLSYDGERPPKEYWSPHGVVRGGIHGGTFDEDGSGSTPMITAVYELLPVAPGAGGTAILPGTHRFSTPRPESARGVSRAIPLASGLHSSKSASNNPADRSTFGRRGRRSSGSRYEILTEI